MAFKMKGNPMKRNFGIGGPAKQRGGNFTAGTVSADPLTPPHKKPHPSEGPLDPQMEGGSPAAQDKFANLANIDLNPKVGHRGVQGTHTMEGLESEGDPSIVPQKK